MRDFMNIYLEEELRKRNCEGIDRKTFISEPIAMADLNDGRRFLGLKGELSTFLNIMRFSCKRIKTVQRTWKNAIFFSEPIIILNFNEIVNFTKEFEIILDEVVFIEDENDELYRGMLKFDSSVTSSEDDDLLDRKIEDENEECCCCNCIIV